MTHFNPNSKGSQIKQNPSHDETKVRLPYHFRNFDVIPLRGAEVPLQNEPSVRKAYMVGSPCPSQDGGHYRHQKEPIVYALGVAGQRGQTLVAAIVSTVIIGVLVATIGSLINAQSTMVRALGEKTVAIDLQTTLMTVLADGSVCAMELTQPGAWLGTGVTAPVTFDSSQIGTANPPTISLNQVLSSTVPGAPPLISVNSTVSPLSNSDVVESILINNIQGVPSGTGYTATLQINLVQSKLISPVRPIIASFHLNTTASGTLETVSGCGMPTPPSEPIIPGGSFCYPIFFGMACLGWASWGACPTGTTSVATSYATGGPTAFICITN